MLGAPWGENIALIPAGTFSPNKNLPLGRFFFDPREEKNLKPKHILTYWSVLVLGENPSAGRFSETNI